MAAVSSLPIEVRRRLWEKSWSRLLRPVLDDSDADQPTETDEPPTAPQPIAPEPSDSTPPTDQRAD
jgi:hypothetical protein